MSCWFESAIGGYSVDMHTPWKVLVGVLPPGQVDDAATRPVRWCEEDHDQA